MAKVHQEMKKNSKLLILILIIAALLRLWRIDQVPVSLFGDELDVGYHAYSILKTGKDYSGNPWPLHFQSLAEWRTPLYLYSVVPTVAIWGISPLGVRLPAAIFGILGVWGIYLLVKELIGYGFRVTGSRNKLTPNTKARNEITALTAAAVLALSPWHIQYSRAAFEVTMLLVFLIFGLYLFFRSLREGKWLWLSSALLVTTPLIYSTAKLFTPVLLPFLLIGWKKEIQEISKKDLQKTAIALVILGGITSYATLFTGGGQRFGYISIFTDPTVAAEVDVARLHDARFRGEIGGGLQPSTSDRFYHNKATFWLDSIIKNLLKTFSTDFLFIKGDPNLRHSIEGAGQFYYIEVITLIAGMILFFAKNNDRKIKLLIAFWLVFGALPSSITRDGGNHATRLILVLPPLVFLISFGLVEGYKKLKGKILPIILATSYLLLFILEFVFYQHFFWRHNPWYSERWWHAGFEKAIQSVKQLENQYDRVFMSMTGEPAWIFFAGWYEYPPDKWQAEFPIGNDVYVEGFGEISHTDKFYFGSPQKEVGGVYVLNKYLSERDLYLANANEIGENLIKEPGKAPPGLKLIKAVSYPSGEPAFYLFSKTIID